MEQGRSDLEKMQNLYSESLIMDWWYNAEKEGDRWAVKPRLLALGLTDALCSLTLPSVMLCDVSLKRISQYDYIRIFLSKENLSPNNLVTISLRRPHVHLISSEALAWTSEAVPASFTPSVNRPSPSETEQSTSMQGRWPNTGGNIPSPSETE